MPDPERLAIVGLGLIGGSFALALRRARPEIQLIGVDLDPRTCDQAREEGAVDATSPLARAPLGLRRGGALHAGAGAARALARGRRAHAPRRAAHRRLRRQGADLRRRRRGRTAPSSSADIPWPAPSTADSWPRAPRSSSPAPWPSVRRWGRRIRRGSGRRCGWCATSGSWPAPPSSSTWIPLRTTARSRSPRTSLPRGGSGGAVAHRSGRRRGACPRACGGRVSRHHAARGRRHHRRRGGAEPLRSRRRALPRAALAQGWPTRSSRSPQARCKRSGPSPTSAAACACRSRRRRLPPSRCAADPPFAARPLLPYKARMRPAAAALALFCAAPAFAQPVPDPQPEKQQPAPVALTPPNCSPPPRPNTRRRRAVRRASWCRWTSTSEACRGTWSCRARRSPASTRPRSPPRRGCASSPPGEGKTRSLCASSPPSTSLRPGAEQQEAATLRVNSRASFASAAAGESSPASR